VGYGSKGSGYGCMAGQLARPGAPPNEGLSRSGPPKRRACPWESRLKPAGVARAKVHGRGTQHTFFLVSISGLR